MAALEKKPTETVREEKQFRLKKLNLSRNVRLINDIKKKKNRNKTKQQNMRGIHIILNVIEAK